MMAFDLQAAVTPLLRERYVLEGEAGKGGMGLVCRAREQESGQPVAIKVLWPELARAVTGQRFLREIEILRRLTHPNLLPLLDSGLVEVLPGLEVPWLAVPYIEGENLAGLLSRTPQLEIGQALEIILAIASALEAVHGAKYVHRDVKPSNILLRADGPVLADFGLARAFVASGGDEELSTTGLLVGTPAYSSPEQSRGERDIDGRSDLYSLGVTLYEMLAGEPPFSGRNPQVIAARHQYEPAPPVRILRPEVPPDLERLLLSLMAKRPADRPASATAVIAALGAR